MQSCFPGDASLETVPIQLMLLKPVPPDFVMEYKP